MGLMTEEHKSVEEKSSSFYVSCYNEEGKLEHFNVPSSVYTYVLQLENEIRFATGGVKKLYNFRFEEEE
jgi:hypothetical protein